MRLPLTEKGLRKLAFGFLGLCFMFAGYLVAVRWPKEADPFFKDLVSGICWVVGGIAAGNVGEHVARTLKGTSAAPTTTSKEEQK